MNNDYDSVAKEIKRTIGILLDLYALDKDDIDKIISVIQNGVRRLDSQLKRNKTNKTSVVRNSLW